MKTSCRQRGPCKGVGEHVLTGQDDPRRAVRVGEQGLAPGDGNAGGGGRGTHVQTRHAWGQGHPTDAIAATRLDGDEAVSRAGHDEVQHPVVVEDRTAGLAVAEGSAADPLAGLDTEDLPGSATMIWVRAAFDPEADPNERVPGGPRLLTRAERERLRRPVTAAS